MADITLNTAQSAALAELLSFAVGGGDSPLCVLEGCAGTGKTTLVSKLLEALEDEDVAVCVMAPTNKAVGVLQAKIAAASAEFGSLHSFLGLRMRDSEDGSSTAVKEGESTLHQYDLAIVDECSMVSEELFRAILMWRRGCRVLFVGDSAQLPPVGDDGAESPVFRMVSNRLRLNEVVRQARGNPIVAASIVVRQAIEQMRRVSLVEIAGAFPPPPASVGVIGGGIESVVDVVEHEIRRGMDCRAVAWTNQAVDAINREMHYRLHPNSQAPFEVGERVAAGSEFRAVVHGGLKQVRIFNSEELTVVGVTPTRHPDYLEIGAWRLTLERDSSRERVESFIAGDEKALKKRLAGLWSDYRSLKRAGDDFKARAVSRAAWTLTRTFDPLRHLYAMTAHKSQGSTFDTSVIVWDDLMRCKSDFDFNRLLYVSMTRASTNLAVVVQ